ncbi:MAG: TIGR04282 family arsenosugar biosynthesis glycosyltransferase [Deltaproteobacteria bacterium]|nr:TIGR04282 family arsenosugar biosynthesis glycosyltransferase [Deltaproteobacteria bacterium]
MTLTPDPRPLAPANAFLIIFAKKPVPGQVKTRLSPPLSPAEAAELYHCFLKDILEEMTGLSGIDVAVAYEPASAKAFFEKLSPEGVKLLVQAEAGLSDRLIEAAKWGFAQGYAAVLMRNSDSPDLPGPYILEGREILAGGRADVVLGPCPDGGYYLVGLRKPSPEIFHEISWSTAAVLEQTLARAAQAGLKTHLLPPWPDIDAWDELLNFLSRSHAPPAAGWRSHAWARERLRPYLPKGLE